MKSRVSVARISIVFRDDTVRCGEDHDFVGQLGYRFLLLRGKVLGIRYIETQRHARAHLVKILSNLSWQMGAALRLLLIRRSHYFTRSLHIPCH